MADTESIPGDDSTTAVKDAPAPRQPLSWLRFYAFFYWNAFLMGFGHQLPLLAVLGLLAAVLVGGFGSALGIPLLFWHDNLGKQFLAGVMVAALNTEVIFVGFLLDTRRPPKFRRWVKLIPRGHRKFDPATAENSVVAEASAYSLGGLFSIIFTAVVIGVCVTVKRLFVEKNLPPDYMHFVWSRGFFANAFLPMGLIAGSIVSLVVTRVWLNCVNASRDVRLLKFLVPGIRSQAEQKLHLIALFNLLLALFIYVAIPLVYGHIGRDNPEAQIFVTPAVSLCILGIVIAAVYGVIKFHVPGFQDSFRFSAVLTNGTFLLVVLLLLLNRGGKETYKHRFSNMDYDHPAYLLDEDGYGKLPKPQLVESEDVQFVKAGEKPKKLVVICASGGGIRSATWTIAVLRQLERALGPDFPYHIRLMTGASGGMVGSAYYVATLKPKNDDPQNTSRHLHLTQPENDALAHSSAGEVEDDFLLNTICQDQLSEPVKSLIYFDIPSMAGPTFKHDRGQALEGEWNRLLTNVHLPFYDKSAQQGELDGWRPSLVFAPMLVEDGRRLLISNLDLDFLTCNSGNSFRNGGVVAGGTKYSRSAYEFARLFPLAMESFQISTAVRMNASFPYVAPAAVLPTLPRRRVVDAGYFDNYGVSVAAGWLHHMATEKTGDWLKRNASGVVVIQIRDGINTLDYRKAAPVNEQVPSALSRGVEFLTTPLQAVANARDSASLFRNDLLLERLTETFQGLTAADARDFPANYFSTIRFEYSGEAALTWSMANSEVADIKTHASVLTAANHAVSDPPTVDDENYWQMQALKQWWIAPGSKAD